MWALMFERIPLARICDAWVDQVGDECHACGFEDSPQIDTTTGFRSILFFGYFLFVVGLSEKVRTETLSYLLLLVTICTKAPLTIV